MAGSNAVPWRDRRGRSARARMDDGSRAVARDWPGAVVPAIVHLMQAFEPKLPPLTTGPDGAIRVAGTRVSLETVVSLAGKGPVLRGNTHCQLGFSVTRDAGALSLAATFLVARGRNAGCIP